VSEPNKESGAGRGDEGAENRTPLLLHALRDAVALFTTLKISYALIGGIAAMTYGRSRFTEDVDFVAAENHQDILAANPEVMRACHFDPGCTWKLYHESGVEIDIWKDEHSNGIAARARSVLLGDQTVMVADVHDLIAMKLRAGRFQDDYDISEILKRNALQESTLRGLVSAQEYARFVSIKNRVDREH